MEQTKRTLEGFWFGLFLSPLAVLGLAWPFFFNDEGVSVWPWWGWLIYGSIVFGMATTALVSVYALILRLRHSTLNESYKEAGEKIKDKIDRFFNVIGSVIGSVATSPIVLFGFGLWAFATIAPLVTDEALAESGAHLGKFLLSMRYDVEREHIALGKKPADCDWGTAPLGTKLCHYKLVIEKQDSWLQGRWIKEWDN